jgi:putative hydrolase of the HAD superfamily
VLIRGVLVDLDDTLYPQAEFLDQAWRSVAAFGATRGLDPDALLGALREETAGGSARGGLIDRALARLGAPTSHVPALLAAFRAVSPDRLTPYPGVVRALDRLRSRVPVGLVTDGEVTGQRRKLAALGLADAFDTVVYSDLAGRALRKPHPAPFHRALADLGLPVAEVVMIGDRPDKDAVGAAAAGMRAVRVLTGEYAAQPDHPGTWLRTACFAGAVCALLPHLAPDPTRTPFVERSIEELGCGPPTAPLVVPRQVRRRVSRVDA